MAEPELRKMRRIFSEKNLVVALFIIVLVIFSFAQEATRKFDRLYLEKDNMVVELSAQQPDESVNQQHD